MNALRREFDAMKMDLDELIATAGCPACCRLPDARMVVRYFDNETVSTASLIGDSDEWGAIGGSCALCGRRPSFDLTLHEVCSLEEAAAIPTSAAGCLHRPILKYQREFLLTDGELAVLCGGLGSGKSYASGLWLLSRLLEYPFGKHYTIGGTTPQLRLGTHVTIRGLLDDLGIEYDWNRTTLQITLSSGPAKGASVIFWSSEVYEGMKSIEVDTALCEELQTWSRPVDEAMSFIFGRMRQSPPTKVHHPKLVPAMRCACNPPRSLSHFIYENWIAEPGEGESPRPPVFLMTTYDNALLPNQAEYIAQLKRTCQLMYSALKWKAALSRSARVASTAASTAQSTVESTLPACRRSSTTITCR